MRSISIWCFFLFLAFLSPSTQAQNSVSQRAIELYRAGEYRQAIRQFQQGIRSGEISKYKGYYFISVVYLKMRQFKKAQKILDRLAEKPLPSSLMKKVERQREKLAKNYGKTEGHSKKEAKINEAMEDFDEGRFADAFEKFEALQRRYKDQTSLFMMGVIYHRLGEVDLAEEFFQGVTEEKFQEDIDFIRSTTNSGGAAKSKKRLQLSATYKRGANSNPVLDNDFSEVAIGDNDTESQLQLDAKYAVYRTESQEIKLEASFYSEDYSFNDDVDSQNIDFGMQWSKAFGEYEMTASPLYSEQKQDDVDLLKSYSLYIDLNRPVGESSEWTLGGSYTENKPAVNFEFLEGQAYSLYGSYLTYWKTSFASLSVQFFKNNLSDEEDLIVSNAGWSVTGSYIKTKGKWTFPLSLKYSKKTYVEDELLSFIRIDKTLTLGVDVQYRWNQWLNLFWENQYSKNQSNQEDESDDRNYTQVRSLVGLTVSY